MPQQSLRDSIADMEKAGLITRIQEEKRVDELPLVMEQNPDTAVLVEKVKDCAFPFFANGYGARPMYALALDCDPTKVGLEMGERFKKTFKPEMVDSAPCQEIVYKGDDVDLTMFPLFQYHPKDGQAYLNDTNVVSRNPENGLIDQGIYRFMYRSKNETNIDMRNATHRARIAAEFYAKQGKDMPVTVLIGGPTLDHVASMMSNPDSDDWEVLGGYYGEPAKLVKCLTNDLTIPANAEVVLEGHIITSEGWVHDEGPYGEYTGTYGGGLPHNNRFVVDCITHRKNAIYQYATIGGMQQALAIMLAGSRQWMPKTAYVFDQDIDIYNDERVKWAQAWRFNPKTGIVLLEGQNMLPLDPSLNTDKPPDAVTKVGFDCTIPLVGQVDLEELERLDSFGFEEAWIGEHFTSQWEPCPAPDLLIAQGLQRTTHIRLGSLGHLLSYHHPIELAHRVAYLDHMAQGRYNLGVGISALPTDHQLFALNTAGGRNRRMTFEALQIMTDLWTHGAREFHGEFWNVGATSSPSDALGYHLRPFQSPHPPIAIAALTPGSENHKLAGAKGYLPVSLSISPDAQK